MDIKKIDKLIKEIELCNSKIAEARNNIKNGTTKELRSDKIFIQNQIKELLWVIPAVGVVIGTSIASNIIHSINPIVSFIMTAIYIIVLKTRLGLNVLYDRLEKENNEALEWLKNKRNEYITQEGTIFESVEFI